MSAALHPVATPIPYAHWRPGAAGLAGDIRVFPDVFSPSLKNSRTVAVYLPPSHEHSQKRYPVLYMHDGQNLFDAATSFAGTSWGVGATMDMLSGEGIEAIVVGIWNTPQRHHEYTPFGAAGQKTAEAYLEFVFKTVKPMIDAWFRTRRTRDATGMMGSSLGGLISTYAFFRYPRRLGFFGALSPAYWPVNGAIYEYVKKTAAPSGRAYLDNGAAENSAKRMVNFLTMHKGFERDNDLMWVEDANGHHDEASWARRLPAALRFLLAPFQRKRRARSS
jgi:predicted alpha/beta superfamily hydrolase